ncbi:hypothetical protein [Planctomicrobium piriforme]|uniref:Uncharacterized protein n=1 Tax=Planctomicrobium piriforme TaxID=1576369 RepID=A0A1I3P1G7_9PLAN|nr:hypothetical protein [Planctomicrobium piriforme]SFJ15182.1 hypothetical protein SAMN05421753_1165 [Planctomicrobium piriforme]
MFEQKHIPLLRAAVLFFDEEFRPHGSPIMRHYLEDPNLKIQDSDVTELRELLQRCQLRYAVTDEGWTTIENGVLFRTPEEIPAMKPRIALLLFPERG